jgi:hypothetical protein
LDAAAVAALALAVEADAFEDEEEEATATARLRVARTARVIDADTAMGTRFLLSLSDSSSSESSESESSLTPSSSLDREALVDGLGRVLPRVRRAVRVGRDEEVTGAGVEEEEDEEAAWF